MSTDYFETTLVNIDDLIKATGRQQQEIAAELGIDSSRIANFKKKRDELGGIGDPLFEKFASILKVKPRELLKLRETNPAHLPSKNPLYKRNKQRKIDDAPLTLGISEEDFEHVGGWIAKFLTDPDLARCKSETFLNDQLSSAQNNMVDHLLNHERSERLASRNQPPA